MKPLAALACTLGLCCPPTLVARAADFVIGVAAPLSGAEAVFGNQVRLGVEQAVADLNASGGFGGLKGRAVARDDASNPKTATEIARSFVAEKIPLVLGDVSSAASVAASAVYAEAGVLNIAPSALAPLLTERGLTTVFRMCGRDDEQADVAVRFLLSRHIARTAIVHDRTAAGKQLADDARKLLGKAGIHDVLYGSVESGTRDVSGIVGRIKTSGAQVVLFGGSASLGGVIAKQLRDSNAHALLLGGAALASDEFAAAADGGADGSMVVFPQDPKTRPAGADLLRRLRARGAEPDAYVFYAYAAVQVVQQAMSTANTREPKAIAAFMHSGQVFKTVLGDVAFNEKGDLTSADYTVYVWHKGASGRMTFDDEAKT